MPIPYTLEELRAATHELIVANELRECYIRPIAFRGYGQMGLYPLDARSRSRSPRGRGAPTWARTASATAYGRRSPAGGGSRTTR